MKSFNLNFLNNNLSEAKLYFDSNGYNNNILNNDFIDKLNKSIETIDGRKQDLWKENNYVKEVASNKDIFNILQKLYNDTPLPFQTLNFTKEQYRKNM